MRELQDLARTRLSRHEDPRDVAFVTDLPHLTKWMGDDGILRRAHRKIRRHNPVGDTLRIEKGVGPASRRAMLGRGS